MTGAPLQDFFRERGIAQREFAPGTATPAQFSDPTAEHLACRRSGGVFDFSFMGAIEISGRDSLAFLHRLQPRNLSLLSPGRLAYTLLLRPDGTVLADATVWRLGADRYCLYIGRRADLIHIGTLASGYCVSLRDRSEAEAVIAVQGGRAWATLSRCVTGLPGGLSYYAFAPARFGQASCRVARIGYSGETGYELIVDAALGRALWEALLRGGAEFGIVECGFDAADSLRIEAGHILFSRELALPVTPGELGFTRLIDFHREPAIGVAILRTRRWREPSQRLVGLWIEEDFPQAVTAASGTDTLPVAGTARLTSACRSPIFGRWLGLGFVAASDRYPATRVKLAGGGPARVARLPFYDPARYLARRVAN